MCSLLALCPCLCGSQMYISICGELFLSPNLTTYGGDRIQLILSRSRCVTGCSVSQGPVAHQVIFQKA